MRKILLLFISIFTFTNIMGENEITQPIDYTNNIVYPNLINEVDTYIDKISPSSKLDGKTIVDMCIKYNIDIMFVLAQGQIESHFGTTGTARKTNSVFNVGAFDGHSAARQTKNGYAFEHPNDSVEPYLILLTNNYLVNDKNTNDLMYNYVNKYNQRYASDKNYEIMLRSVYNKINKTTNINHYQSSI